MQHSRNILIWKGSTDTPACGHQPSEGATPCFLTVTKKTSCTTSKHLRGGIFCRKVGWQLTPCAYGGLPCSYDRLPFACDRLPFACDRLPFAYDRLSFAYRLPSFCIRSASFCLPPASFCFRRAVFFFELRVVLLPSGISMLVELLVFSFVKEA